MSLEITVVGALRGRLEARVHDDGSPAEGELRPAGMAAQLGVALARLGHSVRLVAAVNPSRSPASLRSPLVAEGVTLAAFGRREATSNEAPTAATDDPEREDELELFDDWLEALGPLQKADAVLVQLELPDELLDQALQASHDSGRFTVLHASPARELAPELLARVDVLVATEAEARVLARCLGEKVGAKGLARRLAAFGPGKVVIGGRDEGALLFDGERFLELDGEAGHAEDDQDPSEFVFSAGLLTALVQEWRVDRALRFAERAARLLPSGEGAFPKLPTAEALETCLGALDEPHG